METAGSSENQTGSRIMLRGFPLHAQGLHTHKDPYIGGRGEGGRGH